MIKRISLLFLALVMLLSLGVPAQAATQPVNIVFWHSMSDEAGAMVEKFVAEFNDTIGKEKQIVVEAVFQGKYSDATTKLNSVLTAENYSQLPDVMNLDATGKVAYFNSGHAYTLDDALKADPAYDIAQIQPITLGNWEFSGVKLGMPFAASTSIMFYNKTMLDAAGVKAPETFQDIIDLSGKLPEKTADGLEVIAYSVVPNTPTLANWLGQLGSDMVNNKNGSEAMATELVCIDNGALANFLSHWKAMYDAGALKNVAGTTDQFVAGQLAILTTSSSNITSLLEKIGDSFELGAGYYPKVTADAQVGATVSGSCVAMFDKQDDAKKAAAWELVKYLASPQVQAEFAAATGYVPVNAGAQEAPVYKALVEKQPQYAVPMAQLTLTPAEMKSVTVGPAKDFYYAIQDNIATMLDEGLSVEETVETMADELNGLLRQYEQANK
ncbi:MAG: extracellular solute-binding protein [Christensenellales bacterium]|jgi:sn-glycerol 3-phosphate transport system substrate-binding protein